MRSRQFWPVILGLVLLVVVMFQPTGLLGLIVSARERIGSFGVRRGPLMALLDIAAVTKVYGPLRALDGVDLMVDAGTFHGLIGPNGSGKSTLLKSIAGAHFPTTGTIRFDKMEITEMPPYQRARHGLSLKFQITAVLTELSVYDNVLLALQSGETSWQLLRSSSRIRLHDQVMVALDRFRLADRADDLAGELSHGEQQWLEIAMALARKPKLLLLDEPTGGYEPGGTASDRRIALDRSSPTVRSSSSSTTSISSRTSATGLPCWTRAGCIASGTIDEIEHDQRVQEIYTSRV